MKEPIPTPTQFNAVVQTLVGSDAARSVTKYISPKLVVRATWRHKPSRKHTREEMVLTYGAPNYLETAFVKMAVKAGEPFPIKKVQLKLWPKKKPK